MSKIENPKLAHYTGKADSKIAETLSAKHDASLEQPELSDQQIISYIYDIALDPGNLDAFIDRLQADANEHADKSLELGRIQTLNALLESHLSRAEEFLDRLSVDNHSTVTQQALARFDSTPAVLINAELNIVDANQPAFDAYRIAVGDSLDALPFVESDVDKLFTMLRQMLRDCTGKGSLLAMQPNEPTEAPSSPALLHAHWLNLESDKAIDVAGRRGFVLLVSTDVSWPLALDQTLQEVFGLTSAERDIVRGLVEGSALKTIANERHRSLGTVRSQVKSVLAKTRTHSQSELIRVTLSLMEIVKRSPLSGPADAQANTDSCTALTGQYAEIETLTCKDGRRLDYLVQGAKEGKPVLFSHMGYGLMRWPPAALAMALEYDLKIVSPIRAGFGHSDAVAKAADILQVTRDDTLMVLDHLGIDTCTYVAQGNDVMFALDLIVNHPERVSALVGLGSRFPLPSHSQYAGMGKWHRFLLSTARHAPHLVYFAAKAAFTLARKIGRDQMFRNVHRHSPSDLALLEDPNIFPTLLESSTISLSDDKHAAFAYAKELFENETDWSELVQPPLAVPAWFVSGMQDPLGDPVTIASYREAYPWIEIEVIEDAGQLLFFQQFEYLIPRIAESACANR